jgi:hypothetical protein
VHLADPSSCINGVTNELLSYSIYIQTVFLRGGVFKTKRDYANKTRTVHFSEEL